MNNPKWKQKGKEVDFSFLTKERIITLDDAIKAGKIDTAVWHVKEFTWNKWEMGYVNTKKLAAVVPLIQVKLRLVRRFEQRLEKCAEILFKKLKNLPTITLAPPKVRGDNLLELCLFDAHLGKYTWALETGDNQDTKIQSRVFLEAANKLIANRKGDYDRIMIPLGNDFFQVDNWLGTTTAGTHVDNDGRYTNVFDVGVQSVIKMITWCLPIAPVDLIWIPGNHDQSTSYYLAECIKYRFHDNPNVKVDVGPSPRKYYNYGKTLLGLTHGDQEKISSLPIIMAQEQPKLWSQTHCREWHKGHDHRKMEFFTQNVDESTGVIIRSMESISGTDSWHHKKGYIGNTKAAEAYTFNKEEGYVGHALARI